MNLLCIARYQYMQCLIKMLFHICRRIVRHFKRFVHMFIAPIFQIGVAVGDIDKIQKQAYIRRIGLQVISSL